MESRVKRIICATIVASVVSVSAFSQKNYYLVIGAFSTEKSDVKQITSYLPGSATDTAYTVHSDNSVLHFYVMKSSDKDLVMAKSLQLRDEISKTENEKNTLSGEYKINAGTIKESATAPSSSAAAESLTSGNSPSSGSSPVKPSGKLFKFTISKDNGQLLNGKVHQVDPIQGNELQSYVTDSYIDILKPGQNHPMDFVCSVFGYKEVEKYIDYASPWLTEGAYVDDKGAWVIPYTLEKLERGDVSAMHNLSFYKDAVVMLPQSKRDLDALVEMMTSDPQYEIRVHAHCNGKNSRKIIALGKDHNFFDVNGSEEIEASAKQLTTLRGEAIKSYLKFNGISESRVKIYSWGGSDMLVRPTDPNSKVNDRIEIEILKD